VIGCEDRLRNDLLCVGRGVNLYSLTLTPEQNVHLLYTALQVSRQHQFLEQENSALKEEEKKFRFELRKFRDSLIIRKEVSGSDDECDLLAVLLFVFHLCDNFVQLSDNCCQKFLDISTQKYIYEASSINKLQNGVIL